MTILNASARIRLHDHKGLFLGTLHVEKLSHGALCGMFVAAPCFETVRALFTEFDQCVTDQGLSYLDDVMARIDAIGIYGVVGPKRIELVDIQLFNDGRGSVRENSSPSP